MTDDSGQLPANLLTETAAAVPAMIAARGHHAGRRFVEFFTANIRNPNTRKAYYRAASGFFDWCEQARLGCSISNRYMWPLGSRAGAAIFRRRASSKRQPQCACCSTGLWWVRSWR